MIEAENEGWWTGDCSTEWLLALSSPNSARRHCYSNEHFGNFLNRVTVDLYVGGSQIKYTEAI